MREIFPHTTIPVNYTSKFRKLWIYYIYRILYNATKDLVTDTKSRVDRQTEEHGLHIRSSSVFCKEKLKYNHKFMK
jgi:hypothetical protein